METRCQVATTACCFAVHGILVLDIKGGLSPRLHSQNYQNSMTIDAISRAFTIASTPRASQSAFCLVQGLGVVDGPVALHPCSCCMGLFLAPLTCHMASESHIYQFL